MGVVLLFLALSDTVLLGMVLCCGAYFSKAMAVIGYSAVVVTITAAVQTVWQVGFLESRGTTHVNICLGKMLQLTAMGVNAAVMILAIFYTASEPECRMVNSDTGDIVPVSATTPSGGPTCYADLFCFCYILLAAIIVVGAFEFIVSLMLTEKLCMVNDKLRGK
jgi:hypothetical protein